MPLQISYLLEIMNQAKKRREAAMEKVAASAPETRGTASVGILAFSTSNYDAMLKFFRDFGFSVIENPHDQLTPFFEQGRAARIVATDIVGADFEFQLEESQSKDARACFNLFLTLQDGEIERIKALGYKFEFVQGIYGSFHSFHSPDGGVIVVEGQLSK